MLVSLLLLCDLAGAEDDPEIGALRRAVDGERGAALLGLARQTVTRVASGRPLPDVDDSTPISVSCGVFVTLVGPRGMRGCYGDLNASFGSLEQAVVEAARGAAALDIRFPPVRPSEAASLRVIVSLTRPPEPVADARTVDPDRYGILAQSGDRHALLLPGEARTASWGLDETLRKAGIGRGEPVSFYRFRTLTFVSQAR